MLGTASKGSICEDACDGRIAARCASSIGSAGVLCRLVHAGAVMDSNPGPLELCSVAVVVGRPLLPLRHRGHKFETL